MIVKNLSDLIHNKYFVVIIGSGPAGISTAIKLEKKKIKSLIIEAGDLEYDPKSELFLQGKIIGDKYNDLASSRLRQFGGTSGVWGGQCNPMLKQDFDEWPIEINDLDKYAMEAREILNLKENFYNEKLNENLNLYNLVWSNVRFGTKYFEHIKKSKYIFLSLNTTFLDFKGENNNIQYVNCIKNNKNIIIKSKYFILCCGGIENSRLLLWSRNKNNNLFKPQMPIGKYYMNHPYHHIGEGIVEYNKFFSFIKKAKIVNRPIITCKNNIFISASKKFLEERSIFNSGIYINFKIVNNKNNLFKQLRCVAPNYIKKLYEKIYSKDIYEIEINTLQEQGSYEGNYIDLSEEKDPYNIPLTKIYWKKSNFERKSAKLICEELGNVFVDENIGRLALKEYLFDNDIDYETIVGNHQLGGTRMGFNENESVVDENLRVHNINNLYVNGSSVFRTGGHSHPTYTIVKLSLRLADYLAKV